MTLIAYRYAVVSWCPDLTDPNGPSVPLALLMVGDAGDGYFAAIVGAVLKGNLDPITSAILRDVPGLVKRQLDDMIAKDQPSPDDVVERLTKSLRGSLHVSKISAPLTLTEVIHEDAAIARREDEPSRSSVLQQRFEGAHRAKLPGAPEFPKSPDMPDKT